MLLSHQSRGVNVPAFFSCDSDPCAASSAKLRAHCIRRRGCKIAGDRPFLGTREKIPSEDDSSKLEAGPYAWRTYNEVAALRNAVATEMVTRDLGVVVSDPTLPPPVWDHEKCVLSAHYAAIPPWAPIEATVEAGAAEAADSGAAAAACASTATADVADAAAKADAALISAAGGGAEFTAIATMAKNREELVIINHACYRQSYAVVPLYDTLGEDALLHILGLTGVRTVFAAAEDAVKVIGAKAEALARVEEAGDDEAAWAALAAAKHTEVSPDNVKRAAASLKTLVVFEALSAESAALAADLGLTVIVWEELVEAGKAAVAAGKAAPPVLPKPSSVECVCFTSGTTGVPKGAVLTHGAMVASAAGPQLMGIHLSPDDVYLSYLPYAHLFGRLLHCALIANGIQVGFYSGDPRAIMGDLQVLRPTVFPSVPRLYNRIRDRVTSMAASKGAFASSMLQSAVSAKVSNLRSSGALTHTFWDWAVLSGIKAKLGLDRVRYLLTGSAPMSVETMEWLRVVFGAPLLEGYGQTEDAGALFVTALEDQNSSGHVGLPFPTGEAKLVSQPLLEACVTDTEHAGMPCRGKGEVWLRGPALFRGYLRQPDKTADTLTADGWLRTGDLGMWDEVGRLRIIGRAKEQFKLAQGEYVAPGRVENIYLNARLVQQVFHHGTSLQSQCVAVVVPDPDAVEAWAKAKGLSGTPEAVMKEHVEALKADLLKEMDAVAKECGLNGFEKAKAVHIEPEPWTAENDCLTPSFKLKRAVVEKRYAAVIESMYAELARE